MIKIMIAPNRYVQGPRVLRDTGKYMAPLGSKVFIIGGPTALSLVKDNMSSHPLLKGSSRRTSY